jgi:hypothetical protein
VTLHRRSPWPWRPLVPILACGTAERRIAGRRAREENGRTARFGVPVSLPSSAHSAKTSRPSTTCTVVAHVQDAGMRTLREYIAKTGICAREHVQVCAHSQACTHTPMPCAVRVAMRRKSAELGTATICYDRSSHMRYHAARDTMPHRTGIVPYGIPGRRRRACHRASRTAPW